MKPALTSICPRASGLTAVALLVLLTQGASSALAGGCDASLLKRIGIGRLFAHSVTMEEAVSQVVARASERAGGYVVTPNVEHLSIAEESPEFVAAYDQAFLSTVDGKPLVWISSLKGTPLPERISGSDLVLPVCKEAARRGLRVYLLGGEGGLALRTAEKLRAEIPGLVIAGTGEPELGFEKDEALNDRIVDDIRLSGAHLVFVALGAPKQELWMMQNQDRLGGAVALGIGGAFKFIAGDVRRAPLWMQQAGLEWFFRITEEPSRLPRFARRALALPGILWREFVAR